MPKKDRVEEWKEQGVLEEKLTLMRSLSMQGLNVKEIGSHDEIRLSERQMVRLTRKYSDFRASIKKGREYVVSFAQNALMRQVSEGNITAIIYALKVYGGEFFKENKIEIDLHRAELELRKQQAAVGNKEDDRTIVFNIKAATGIDVEQESL